MSSTTQYLKKQYNAAKALGSVAKAADAFFVIDGHEHLKLLCKGFPIPLNSPGPGVEVYLPGAHKTALPGQTQTCFESPVSFYETQEGHLDRFSKEILTAGARFKAYVYVGSMVSPSQSFALVDAWITFDQTDVDVTDSSGAMMKSGTLTYHYFGEAAPLPSAL